MNYTCTFSSQLLPLFPHPLLSLDFHYYQLGHFKGIYDTSASGQDGVSRTGYTLQKETTKVRQNTWNNGFQDIRQWWQWFLRARKQMRWSLQLAQVTFVRGARPWHRKREESQVEPDRFPGLRRQTRESKDTKAAGVYRTEYWGRENCTEREFWIYAESLSSFLLAFTNTHLWGRKLSMAGERTIPKN